MKGIHFQNVSKSYDGKTLAVKNFNLEIVDKEFVVFVGPSGCGKSTVLRMIAGLEDLTEGSIFIDDVVINEVEAKDRNIAMVFQNYALYPSMNVYDNIAFSLKLSKMPKKEIEQKVRAAAKMLQLEELLKRKPKQLSGGQRQRVALGRAIVRNPKVFLLDEPLSNLDAKLRTELRTGIINLHKKVETTFIYVTHDQVEAMTMADKIVVMNNGVIQQVDSPKNIYMKPNNLFVAEFIGTPKINLFNGVLRKDQQYYVELKDNRIPVSLNNRSKIDEYLDKEIIVGVRPEDIHIKEEGGIRYNILRYEMLGAQSYIYLQENKGYIIAEVDKDFKAEIKEVSIIFDSSNIHLFDKDTKQAIHSKG